MADELYSLPAEHRALREAVRELCDSKVAPNAASVDETGQFPQDSYDALRASHAQGSELVRLADEQRSVRQQRVLALDVPTDAGEVRANPMNEDMLLSS